MIHITENKEQINKDAWNVLPEMKATAAEAEFQDISKRR